ncbi:CBS domain-containing protein [Dechloromonas sp. TW-R-39-2]|uniref:CBS domain-containing protein n=1 Tax=Dechloromonas TaxID=73029 RepID=UPI00193CDCDF|nr:MULTISPECIES: CBS domain-containing protein [Dechloromonas]QRM19389.1 CBS domain-containing protein [Dechloromonas sp. TW-R-39-2]UCV12836.1 CBS domain-containing protein [Dechloromonas denitrificans]
MPKRLVGNLVQGRALISTTKDVSVRAACRLMASKRIGALLVLENQGIVGIFTERDALNKVLAASLDPDTTSVASVMVADPQTIRADKPLAYALHMMAEGGFRHVPVVDDQGAPLGMVSARDALGQDLVDLERDMRRLEELENSIGY